MPESWYNAGAVSVQALNSGDGYFQVTASDVNTRQVFGMGWGSPNPYYGFIDYTLSMEAGTLCIYEWGTPRGCFGSYQPGDWLTIAVQNGQVVYMQNNTIIYRSSVAPHYPLYADTSLYTPGGTINNAVIAY